MLIIGEVTLLVDFKEYPLINFMARFESINLINLITLVPIGYMFCACLILFFSIKVNGLFIFQLGHTDTPTFLFFSNMLSKIGFPLCYNFGQLLKSEKKLQINGVITGNGNEGKNSISDFIMDCLPLVLIMFLFIKLFGFYDYLVGLLGFKTRRDNSDVSMLIQSEGKNYLESQTQFKDLDQNLLES